MAFEEQQVVFLLALVKFVIENAGDDVLKVIRQFLRKTKKDEETDAILSVVLGKSQFIINLTTLQ